MKMKKLLAWLLAFVMCFMLAACSGSVSDADTNAPTSPSTAPITAPTTALTTAPTTETTLPAEVSSVTPLLYKVTYNDSVCWLFGSIHVGQENYYPLPDYVMDAYNSADSLAVEFNISAFEADAAAMVEAMSCLVYRDGTTIKDHIPEDLYNEVVEILTENVSYIPALDYYCPMFWSSMIDSLMVDKVNANVELGIDRHFIDLATQSGKEILDVESAMFQYQMMADFSEDLQVLLLSESVAAYQDIDLYGEEMQALIDLWASGDEEAFIAYLATDNSEIPEEQLPLLEEYKKAMDTDRNIAMADFVMNALNTDQEVFVCVGAAHVVGEGAMVDLLTQLGCTVEIVG